MTELATPGTGPEAAEQFVAEHLSELVSGPIQASPSIRGGQRAADAALAAFDVTGYAGRRNEVFPAPRRGASQLSPYIRHGLLPLREVWNAVAEGPSRDVRKFRDELDWQEFARHWYARLGRRTAAGIRRELTPGNDDWTLDDPGWDRSMACLDLTVGELESDGWLVNQTRMWLASQWSVRDDKPWQGGEEYFFRHLLDGSRAANRLGWQWTTGVGSSKHYGFSRWQVEKRAPGLCDTCPHRNDCPIQQWPDDPEFVALSDDARSEGRGVVDDPTAIAGPSEPVTLGSSEAVWLTAESLGATDPALAANPDLPVWFVFDQPLLAGLQLAAKRLIFLVETLAEMAEERNVRLFLGSPEELLADRDVAVTFAPVPGFRRRADAIGPVEVHPWPWLHRPTGGKITSFSAWRRSGLRPDRGRANHKTG